MNRLPKMPLLEPVSRPVGMNEFVSQERRLISGLPITFEKTLPAACKIVKNGAEGFLTFPLTSDQKVVRAILVSHLVSIHIKHFVGKLSALCGAMTASTGAACGLVYLLGGDVDAMGRAVRIMEGDLAGMICDGAKYTCALKVASTTSAAIRAARLAMKNHAPGSDNGICDDDPEKAILHLGRLATEGMKETDRVILDIMVKKKEELAYV